MNGLSDAQLQFLLLDRTTFKQFAGLRSVDQAPDQKTLWKYRDMLEKAGCIEELVAVFKEQLEVHGYELQTGTIVDSSLVQCNRQRNTREENALVKEDEVPADWEENPANVHDSQVFEVLLETHPPNGHEVYADSAYRSEEGIKNLVAKKFKPRIIHKAKRGKPLNSRQKILNHGYSKVRCRVEHVFGSIGNDMTNR